MATKAQNIMRRGTIKDKKNTNSAFELVFFLSEFLSLTLMKRFFIEKY